MEIYNTREEYNKDHVVCPKCGKETSQTYMGFVFVKNHIYKDENKCACSCGWTGIVDQLIKKEIGKEK